MYIALLCILLSVYQCDACLDLLVRAFNEIFSPIIETGDERREQAHDVDDLTHFYKRDEDGNFILNDAAWAPANPFLKRSNNPSNEIVGSLFNQLRSNSDDRSKIDEPVSCHQEEESDTDSDTDSDTESDTDSNDETNDENQNESEYDEHDYESEGNTTDPTVPENKSEKRLDDELPPPDYQKPYEYNHFLPRGGYYVPGKRPLVDFFIKLLEMFQLTADSKFITSRPRYKKFRYLSNTQDSYK